MARECKFDRFTRFLSISVVASLFLTSVCIPPSARALSSIAADTDRHLNITILEGEGALNNIRQRDAREPVVQVTDDNHKPVAGAALLFLIHSNGGATATFGENSLTFSTTTDAQGIAHATGLHLGPHPGSITITVTASVAGVVAATAVIQQSNVITALNSTTSAGSSSSGGTSASSAGSTTGSTVAKHGILHLGKVAVIGAGVAAAVVVTVVVLNQSSSTALTLGGTTVGHP